MRFFSTQANHPYYPQLHKLLIIPKEDSPSWTDTTYVLNSEEIKHEVSHITILINYLLLYHS